MKAARVSTFTENSMTNRVERIGRIAVAIRLIRSSRKYSRYRSGQGGRTISLLGMMNWQEFRAERLVALVDRQEFGTMGLVLIDWQQFRQRRLLVLLNRLRLWRFSGAAER